MTFTISWIFLYFELSHILTSHIYTYSRLSYVLVPHILLLIHVLSPLIYSGSFRYSEVSHLSVCHVIRFFIFWPLVYSDFSHILVFCTLWAYIYSDLLYKFVISYILISHILQSLIYCVVLSPPPSHPSLPPHPPFPFSNTPHTESSSPSAKPDQATTSALSRLKPAQLLFEASTTPSPLPSARSARLLALIYSPSFRKTPLGDLRVYAPGRTRFS